MRVFHGKTLSKACILHFNGQRNSEAKASKSHFISLSEAVFTIHNMQYVRYVKHIAIHAVVGSAVTASGRATTSIQSKFKT